MIGVSLGPFKILEQIGWGGMGVVYRAHDEHLDRDVALKLLTPGVVDSETSRKRFHREALALSRLNHPAIATLHALHHEAGHDFLVMEFIEGESLDRQIAGGALPESEVIAIGEQLASGLAAAHREGVIHRDLKPANLMMTPEGRLKILDFGLAAWSAPQGGELPLTVEDTVPGTLIYLAPELLNGARADKRSDIYAAGLVLYEAATGSTPFPGLRGPSLLDAIMKAPAQPPRARNPRISRALSDLIVRCLDKKPEARPATAAALGDELRSLASGGRRGHSRRVVAAALALIAVAAAVLAAEWIGVPVGETLRRIGQPSRPANELHSWAVLPLSREGEDPSLAYYAEGMGEELVGQLSGIPSLRVISYPSSRRYTDRRVPPRRIAWELGADGLVMGDLRVSRGKMQITAHLVDGRVDRELWSDSFEGDTANVLALQNRVARAILREVQRRLGPGERARFENRGPDDPAAYTAYLRARYHWGRRPTDLFRAIEYFERVIQADSLYAPAHAGLADAWAAVGLYGLMPPLETRGRARACARRAVAIDEDLSDAHEALAQVLHNYDWDWEGAEAEYRRALDLNPNNAVAHHGYAHLLAHLGRFDEGRREIRTALELNPLSIATTQASGAFEYYAGNHEGALAFLRSAAELDSGNALTYRITAVILDRMGREAEALQALARSFEVQGQAQAAAALRRAYAANGLTGAVDMMIAGLIRKRASGAYEPAEHVAELHARLGRVEEALQWLEIAYREHDTELNRLKVDPIFDPLRKDPRFTDLMRRVGFSAES